MTLPNLKAQLIFLVVLGHLISKMKGSSFYVEYSFIYSFHMPLFIFISGYFSKELVLSKDYKKIVRTLLIPYIILEILYGITDQLLYGKSSGASLLYPNWGIWYLLSLFSWRLLLNIVIRYKYSLYVLIVIGLIIGYDNSIGRTLSFSRTLVFW